MWKQQTYIGDSTAKLWVNLGRCAVRYGFKYEKTDADEDMLVVELRPGDCMMRFGSARSWCSACVGITSISSERGSNATATAASDLCSDAAIPFDFCQLKTA